MDLPVNIKTYLESFTGNTNPINAANFSKEELAALREVIAKKAKANQERQWSLENLYLDTPSEYRRSPEQRLETTDGKRYTPQEVSYSDYQNELKRKIDSYKKNPKKTSVSYGDYDVKSGENAAATGQGWLSALHQSYTDPRFRLASTLGSFNAYDEGDKYRIEDTYGFKNGQQWFYKTPSTASLYDIIKSYWNQPGSLGEVLYNKYKPQNQRQVLFNINK